MIMCVTQYDMEARVTKIKEALSCSILIFKRFREML